MSSPRRLSLCWLALMLLLKAALPLLAAGAAQAQGRTLVEVCTVYGVKTVVLDAAGQVLGDASDESKGSHSDTASPGADHCPLVNAVGHAAPARTPAHGAVPSSHPDLRPPATAPPRACLDAAARWAARVHHAPPILS
ncbi:MAG: hypothetical protein ACK4ZD_11650 [Caldimonas sp.]|jgi:hypothetical protein|uniref:hypothetical protein n=1 Tax=Caldimonas sp. TaxID=2838790 RepID=UPI00391A7FC4